MEQAAARLGIRSAAMLGKAGSRKRSSGDTSLTSDDEVGPPERWRVMAPRTRNVLMKCLEEKAAGQLTRLSHLERCAIRERTSQQCSRYLEEFCSRMGFERITDVPASGMDKLLTEQLEHLYLIGMTPATGAKLVAAVMHARSEFQKAGSMGPPRAWRSLRGWAFLTQPCPGRRCHGQFGRRSPTA